MMEVKAVDLRGYYPLVIRDVREFQAVAGSEEPEIRKFWNCLEGILKNQFVMTADDVGIGMFEKQLKIIPAGSATLEERRFRVLAAMAETLPYTERRLREMLASLCGEDGYKLEIDRNVFEVHVKVELVSKRNKGAVMEMMERVLPVNMIFHVDLLYNQHQMLRPYTHGQMRHFCHEELRNEVLTI